MKRARGVAVTALALAGLLIAQGAQAAACMDSETEHAVRLVEFEILMMTVSLRCVHVGQDSRPTYERMVGAHAATFTAANAAVKRRLGAGNHALDRYVTQVANRYGGGATDLGRCRMFETVAAQLATGSADTRMLDTVADAMIRTPQFPDVACRTGP